MASLPSSYRVVFLSCSDLNVIQNPIYGRAVFAYHINKTFQRNQKRMIQYDSAPHISAPHIGYLLGRADKYCCWRKTVDADSTDSESQFLMTNDAPCIHWWENNLTQTCLGPGSAVRWLSARCFQQNLSCLGRWLLEWCTFVEEGNGKTSYYLASDIWTKRTAWPTAHIPRVHREQTWVGSSSLINQGSYVYTK